MFVILLEKINQSLVVSMVIGTELGRGDHSSIPATVTAVRRMNAAAIEPRAMDKRSPGWPQNGTVLIATGQS